MPEQDPAVEMALIRADLEAMQAELKAVRKELKDLLEAWNTATGVVRFVKWLSTLVAALAVITAAIKGFSGR
jgi:ribosomal protein S12 methylthiotransferase accessory factor YcaO